MDERFVIDPLLYDPLVGEWDEVFARLVDRCQAFKERWRSTPV